MPDSTVSPARVRFAPSPTGYLHIGGLRTALYNYLLARQTGGAFILRVEDTDQKRFVADAEADIYASLAWAGLHPDEGPREGGPHGPYRQSERGRLYDEAIAQLLEAGHAYYAFDSEEELQSAREAAGGNFKYGASSRMAMRNSLSLPAEEVARLRASGAPCVVRLRCPDDEIISFTDLIRGPVQFASETLDDQVLLKSDGLPTYHLANVVDDHDMGITHVIRGEEWLSSVPKHLLLYRYLGWTAPAMAHLPLIMNPKGGKLSKRDGAALGIPVLVHQYQEGGYAPEAVLNFLALLGWNPGTDQELFSLEELTTAFDLSRVGSSGTQFSMDKLAWYQAHYFRAQPADDLARAVQSACPVALSSAQAVAAVALLKERVSSIDELIQQDYLWHAPQAYDEKAVAKRWKPQTAALLESVKEAIRAMPESEASAASFHGAIEHVVNTAEVGFGAVAVPLRIAMTGTMAGPDLSALMAFLGIDAVCERIDQAITTLGG